MEFSEIKTFGKTGRYGGKSGMSSHLSGANAQFIIVPETLLCGGRQNGKDGKFAEIAEKWDLTDSVID